MLASSRLSSLRAVRSCRGAFSSAGVDDGVSGRDVPPVRLARDRLGRTGPISLSQRSEVSFSGLIGLWKCQAGKQVWQRRKI